RRLGLTSTKRINMSRRRAHESDEFTVSHHNKRPCSGLISYDRYTVAWICALPIEMAAARAMLDEEHRSDLSNNLRMGLRNDPLLREDSSNEALVRDHPLQNDQDQASPRVDDGNSYVLGTIQRQNVVIACLPTAEYGTNNAAIVMSNLKRTFPRIDICLMVGIGGGVPTKADIRLGDIVVGTRVMQSDLGKTVDGELQRTAIPRIPSASIRTVISNLRSRHELEGSRVPMIMNDKMQRYPAFGLPNEPDRLFQSSYSHPSNVSSCDECDKTRLEKRKNRNSRDPVIHYGGIASGNQVIKDAASRNKIATELDIICFEMEAAGIMSIEPCLPIRGICDYSDSHKAKEWQRYAAATAAAYAYELLGVRGEHRRDIEPGHIPNTMRKEHSALTTSHEQLLESLNFESIDARKTTIKAAQSKTCRWFLKHEAYLAWKDPDKTPEHHGFLWIRGKPGAGKSTIMKFIYLDTKKSDKKNEIVTASFFFNARGDTLERTVSGMYRSLLLQLFTGFPDLQCVLDDSDLIPQNQTTCPSLNCLKDLLRSAVLKLGQRSFTCFIDALDECDEQQVMDLVSFFEDVAETCTESRVRLQICFSSRHYPYIDIKRGIPLTVERQEGHASDLESYINFNLRIKDPALLAELKDQMLVKASGVFLWVVLVVDRLNDENRRGRLNLRKRLEQIPNGLGDLFREMLRRDASNEAELQLCLMWILLSKRPLKPDEYYHALWSGLYLEGVTDSDMPEVDAIDANDCFEKSVISSSKGLAEITKGKAPTVQFMHESVRDFLIKDRGLTEIWPELKADWEDLGHDKLKNYCSFYFQFVVAMNKVPSIKMKNTKYPFLEYASRQVLSHADSAAGTYCQDEFLREFPTRDWVGIVNRFEKHDIRKFKWNADLLYVLADGGHSSLIKTRRKGELYIGSRINEERYGHPLTVAMAKGHRESVLSLLGLSSPIHEGLDITYQLTPNIGSGGNKHTPISWACEHGYLGIAKLLLQRGASTDPVSGWTLLMYAAKGGSIEVAKWLVDIGEDIRASRKKASVISLAVESGSAEVVKLLLDQGIDPDYIIPNGEPILNFALNHCHSEMAQVLLDHGADVEIADNSGRRPVHCVRSKAMLEELLKRRADINARNYLGETCYWYAILHYDAVLVYFLIEHGLSVNTRRHDGETCLFWAVQLGWIEMTKLLCNIGAEVNARNHGGNNCLHTVLAKNRPPLQVVKLLLDAGLDVNATNYDGQTYLHCLGQWFQGLKSDDDQLLQTLGINVNARDKRGNTPLHLASRKSIPETIDDNLSLALGTGSEAHHHQGTAAERLGIWLRHGANIDARNHQGETPLDIARKEGNEVGRNYLLEKGGRGGSSTDCLGSN
ncbi:hypothetical protein LB507_009050, partial [Fusarium sp. FIESC RH6]